MGIGTTTPDTSAKLHIFTDGYSLYGPNSTWGAKLRVGGNGNVTNDASVVATNGNLHLDAASGAFGTYLNYYHGTGGVLFGNGAGATVGSISSGGGLTLLGGASFGENVGIGPVSATSGLVVSKEGANYSDGAYFLVNSSNATFGGGATVAGIKVAAADGEDYKLLRIQNAGGTKFLIDGAGKVGIGTASPIDILEISRNVQNETGGLSITNRHTAGGSGYGNAINFYASRASPAATVLAGQIQSAGDQNWADASSTSSRLTFGTVNANSFGERMRITSAGNVGIGTTLTDLNGPLGLLSISKAGPSVGSTVMRIEGRSVGHANYTLLSAGHGGSEDFVIKASGSVGIGTPTPGEKLDVVGDAIVRGPQGFDAVGKTATVYLGNTDGFIRSVYDGGLRFQPSSLGVAMSILTGGNVGIGTPTPTEKLEVAGNLKVSGTLTAANISPSSFTANNPGGSTRVVAVTGAPTSWGGFSATNDSGFTGAHADFITFGSSATNPYFNQTAGNWTALVSGGAPSNGLMVGTATAKPLILGTNNTERVRVDASGNVGIGTVSPASPLTVVSNSAQLRLGTGSGPDSYFATLSARYDAAHPFAMSVANNSGTPTEYLGVYANTGSGNERVVFPNGNVGIGTATPNYKLDVNGEMNVSGAFRIGELYFSPLQTLTLSVGTEAWVKLATIPNNHSVRFQLRSGSSNSEEIAEIKVFGTYFVDLTGITVERQTYNDHLREVRVTGSDGGSKVVYVKIRTSEYAPSINWRVIDSKGAVTIHNEEGTPSGGLVHVVSGNLITSTNTSLSVAGNVGIGTSAPRDKLDVVTSGTGGLTVVAGTNAPNIFAGGHAAAFYSTAVTGGLGMSVGANNRSLIQAFKTTAVGGSGASTEDGTLLLNPSGGNVGIGTTDPATKLDVAGTVQGSSFKLSSALFNFIDGTATDLIINGDDNIVFRNENTVERMRIAGSGNVGIGTPTPTAKLDVNGNANVSGNLTIAGTFTAPNLAASSGTLTGSSDSGLSLNAGGTDKNVTLSPSGAGATVLNGKVGVGTANPTVALDVAGDIAASQSMVAYGGRHVISVVLLRHDSHRLHQARDADRGARGKHVHLAHHGLPLLGGRRHVHHPRQRVCLQWQSHRQRAHRDELPDRRHRPAGRNRHGNPQRPKPRCRPHRHADERLVLPKFHRGIPWLATEEALRLHMGDWRNYASPDRQHQQLRHRRNQRSVVVQRRQRRNRHHCTGGETRRCGRCKNPWRAHHGQRCERLLRLRFCAGKHARDDGSRYQSSEFGRTHASSL